MQGIIQGTRTFNNSDFFVGGSTLVVGEQTVGETAGSTDLGISRSKDLAIYRFIDLGISRSNDLAIYRFTAELLN